MAIISAQHLLDSRGKIHKHKKIKLSFNVEVFTAKLCYNKAEKLAVQIKLRTPHLRSNLVLQNKYSRNTNERTRRNLSNENQNFLRVTK